MCVLNFGDLNGIKRITELNGQPIIEVVSEKGTESLRVIKFGHRASAKLLTVKEGSDHQQIEEKWFPRIEANGVFVFIKDDQVPEGITCFNTRYLALNFARRYLAKQHKKTPVNS
ncbi:hypothetical protein PP175_12550 [Aneurinibacillus sp. Ricciae_BoGa-3]|uniref:hypothetical protein n=1 Tax=Aneurinibacillus sp. Ricciae_BoGa-3 TaxID=3022697 RepID=UPI0023423896|nr:hypothetical protein [Aneurinibacillus sp. Ricciae_BoGa-3]WCK56668.1 hypothetical protein PP175_12550 [Aneurinibacillus sp. Ricciae_BoGa-3]